MKSVRVRETAGNGRSEAGERHLTWSELRLQLANFAAEAAPLARRGHWLVRETTLALRRNKSRRARLRSEATLLLESARLDAEAAARAEATRRRKPPSRAPKS